MLAARHRSRQSALDGDEPVRIPASRRPTSNSASWRSQLLQPAVARREAGAHHAGGGVREVGGMTAAHRDTARKAGERRPAADRVHAPAQPLHARPRGGAEPIVQPIDPAAEIVLRGDDHLGRRRRRRRPQVGDEVGNRDVGLVSDGGNHRNRRPRDRARDHFFVERPEVLDRAAAAADDDDVDARHAPDRPQRRGRCRAPRLRPERARAG